MQDRNFAILLKEKLKIFSLITLFPDIRKNPEIPLRDIILSLFLMPFFGLTSLLSLIERPGRNNSKSYSAASGRWWPVILL